MNEFNEDEIKKLSAEMCGQEIDEIRIMNDCVNSYLEIAMSDGRVIRFRYGWIYEFEVKEN